MDSATNGRVADSAVAVVEPHPDVTVPAARSGAPGAGDVTDTAGTAVDAAGVATDGVATPTSAADERPTSAVDAKPTSGADASPTSAVDAGPRSWWRRRQAQVLLVLAATAFPFLATHLFGRSYNFFDMRIYHGAMQWWASGEELYDFISPATTLGFTYPPFAAVTMLPIAAIPMLAAGWLNTVLALVALGVIVAVLLLPLADRYGWPRWLTVAVALPLALALEPNRETIGFGQINLLLFGLIILDLVALRRGWRWAGLGIGLATAIKLTPGLFILYFLISRQWRAAAVASGGFAGATLFAWLVAPRESVTYFTSLMWDSGRVGNADFAPNQALSGLLARLYDQADAPTLLWLSFAALCLALGLSRAAAAHHEGDELTAFTLVGITAAVISPISWTHHLVFVLPAVVILLDTALRRSRSPLSAPGSAWAYGVGALLTYVLFIITPVWWFRVVRLHEGHSHYDNGLWGVMAENSLILGLILLLVLLPRRAGADPVGPDRPLRARRRTLPVG